MKKMIATATAVFMAVQLFAQGWQQRVEYKMDVQLNAANHQFKGRQSIVYTNNSPDVLTHLYFHLYFNAFQPGSAMDVRSRSIVDPDPRVGSRIVELTPEQQGYLHVTNLTVNGKSVTMVENETILEVKLEQPIAAGAKATLQLDFEGQVPVQIRRSGRNSAEGIDYSMSQWYPKLCEYDRDGWHPNPYIGREFYGVWGDFEVNITLDKKYIVAGTGILQNPTECGGGYVDASKVSAPKGNEKTWKFKAQNVHDFVWAADPDYVHFTAQVPDGPLLRFFHQNDPAYAQNWKDATELIVKGFAFLSKNYGKYPYTEYSIIQGGDGGMEYPMATLVTGNRKLPSLVGVVMHEAAHCWYQGILGTNESLYCWMDEGFTSYASTEAMASLFAGRKAGDHGDAYTGYLEIVREGKEEGLTTHADHFITNYAYGTAAYNKGETYLAQLGYIIGRQNLAAGLLKYYDKWKFRHPDAQSFIHEMELQSGLVLDWYNEYFVQSTKTIDYAITAFKGRSGKCELTLERKGLMPMPVELEVQYADGTKQTIYIPLDLMRGEKPNDTSAANWTVAKDWKWVDGTYTLVLPVDAAKVTSFTIDPDEGTADTDRTNNFMSLESGEQIIIERK